MKNELLWALMLIMNFGAILFAYKKFGKIGLFIWIPISTILANVQVLITLKLFGFTATLGNIIYASGFLVTDILSENYGRKDAQKAVAIGFFSLITTTIIMNTCLLFMPADDPSSAAMFESLKGIFSLMPRITVASLTAYLISQKHDVWSYHFWKNIFSEDKHIWIRNNLSTMISQFIDSVIFTIIAFTGILPKEVMFEIFITTYVLKWLVAAADTPFLYIAAKMKKNGKISEIITV